MSTILSSVCQGDPGKVANSTSDFDSSVRYKNNDASLSSFDITCDAGTEAEADVTVQTVSCGVFGWDTSHLRDCKPGTKINNIKLSAKIMLNSRTTLSCY